MYLLESDTVSDNSSFDSASIKKRELYENEAYRRIFGDLQYPFEEWEKHYKEPIELLVVSQVEDRSTSRSFKREGIAFEFSRIQSINDIENFANKYGLLGVNSSNSYAYENLGINDDNVKSHYPIEPVQVWFEYVQIIRDLLRLYRALKKSHNGGTVEIEENILYLNEISSGFYQVNWANRTPTNVCLTDVDAATFTYQDIAQKVFINTIQSFINNGQIFIHPLVVTSSRTPTGVNIVETKYSKNLITAIYYDLWKLLSTDTPTSLCANRDCKLPFIKKNRKQEYCSNACKQQEYRYRKNE